VETTAATPSSLTVPMPMAPRFPPGCLVPDAQNDSTTSTIIAAKTLAARILFRFVMLLLLSTVTTVWQLAIREAVQEAVRTLCAPPPVGVGRMALVNELIQSATRQISMVTALLAQLIVPREQYHSMGVVPIKSLPSLYKYMIPSDSIVPKPDTRKPASHLRLK
jgi:hypothetical protein